MAGVSNGTFWSNPAEQTMQLSSDSMQRMLRLGAWHRRNGEEPPAVKHLVKWQHATIRDKHEAEDNLQGVASCMVSVQHDLGVLHCNFLNHPGIYGDEFDLSHVQVASHHERLVPKTSCNFCPVWF